MSPATDHPGDLLSAYLDGELPSDEARRVEAHLVGCGACAAELDDLAAARRLLRDLPPVPAPPGFTRAVVERRRRSTRRGAGLALVAASIAVVAGLALADPPEDRPSGPQPMSLSGDNSRLETTPSPFSTPGGGTDEPLPAPDGPDGLSPSPNTPPSTSTPPTTLGTTTAPEDETGSEETSDPVTFGDRIEDVAANLLGLIGG